MPNTLGHLGAQQLLTRAAFRAVDLRWVYVGCVLPDAPWILNRALRGLGLHGDPYALRLYCVAQASLFVLLFLCAALALVSPVPKKTFLVLALNAVLHLLLDAAQARLGNGVQLLAPFHWTDLGFGWFWPEAWPSTALTVLGLVLVLYVLVRRPGFPVGLDLRRAGRVRLAGALLAAWFTLPFLLTGAVEAADCHFVGTLRDAASRPGRTVEVDRGLYLPRPAGDVYRFWSEEEFAVVGLSLPGPAKVSVRAVFLDPHTLSVEEAHVHHGSRREWASYVGLGLIALLCLLSTRRPRAAGPGTPAPPPTGAGPCA
ncbi:MAG: hypothetical protein ACE5JG_06335 [Planctomycetota bacterium]